MLCLINKYFCYEHKPPLFGEKSVAYFKGKEDSIDIEDKLDFKITINITIKKNKKKALNNIIKNRIKEKNKKCNEIKDITLLGHSLFDYWEISNLKNYTVNNLGIAGISTKEYLELILRKDLIKNIGNKIILFAGTNDIVIDKWVKEDTLEWILETINSLKLINNDIEVFFIEIPKVVSRMDRSNKVIDELNSYLKENLKEKIKFIELNYMLDDNFGNLKIEYTYNDLQFNDYEYEKLKETIEGIIG